MNTYTDNLSELKKAANDGNQSAIQTLYYHQGRGCVIDGPPACRCQNGIPDSAPAWYQSLAMTKCDCSCHASKPS